MDKDPIKPAKVADAVAGHIEMLVLEGVLRPGEKLLPERELAERFEVSRPSLREALQKLEEKGIVSTSREGTVVSPLIGEQLVSSLARLMQAHPETTFAYLEFRGIVEAAAAQLAALRATDVDREQLRSAMERMEASHGKDDASEEADADADLHLGLYEAAHNIVLLHIMRALGTMLRQDVFYNRNALYTRRGVREELLAQHRAIYDAVIAGDPQAAHAATEHHITFTRDTLREIREAEARREASLRRLGRTDLVSNGPRRG
jgi:GntR family transcriptional regulator, transcriptional repressor for pyruvate dehydrogenase complex